MINMINTPSLRVGSFMTAGGSKDLVQLAQWPSDFDALDVEAERADFGRLATKASELADLLRVLRGSVMRSPALPKVSWWILVSFLSTGES